MATDSGELVSRYFTRAQLACPCCGECDLDHRLLAALEELRRKAGVDIEVTCAYKCGKHNRDQKGVSKSAHLQGRAADIRIPGLSLQQMYDLALSVDAFFNGGIGVYDTGELHVDVRVLPARWARVKGLYLGLGSSGLLEP